MRQKRFTPLTNITLRKPQEIISLMFPSPFPFPSPSHGPYSLSSLIYKCALGRPMSWCCTSMPCKRCFYGILILGPFPVYLSSDATNGERKGNNVFSEFRNTRPMSRRPLVSKTLHQVYKSFHFSIFYPQSQL